jgi:hypothetical protein
MFFRDLISMDASELNDIDANLMVSFLYQLMSGFVQVCLFSTSLFDAICFVYFLTRLLINRSLNLDIRSVLNF